jgi:hypothetical protein
VFAGRFRPSTWPKVVAEVVGFALLAGLVFQRLLALAHAAPTDFDDAYMYLRYASHYLAGDGLAWNRGQGPVYGVTSLLHFFVVAAVRWSFPGLAPGRVLQVASGGAALGLLAALVAAIVLCGRLTRTVRAWAFWGVGIVSLLAFREPFVFHAGTGMDTMLAALTNTVLVFFTLQFAQRPTPTRAVWTASAAFLTVLARPDNLLVAGFCPILAIVLLAPRPWWKPLVLFAGLLGVLLAGLAAASWQWLGTPVPLAFFAKRPWYYGGFAGEFTWNPYLFLRIFLAVVWPFAAVWIILGDGPGLRRAAALLAPVLASLAALVTFNQIMGHLGRFYFPFLPFFVVGGAWELGSWWARTRPGSLIRLDRILLRAGLAIVLAVVADVALLAAAEHYQARAQGLKLASLGGFHILATTPLPELDSWQSAHSIAAIAASAPPRSSFAMSEHGLPGALAPEVVIVDVLGLHDAFFAQHGFSAAELFRRRPDVIWMPHPDHTQMLREILDHPDFWTHYTFYPDALTYGVALRVNGSNAGRLSLLLRSEWNRLYPGRAMVDYQAWRGD